VFNVKLTEPARPEGPSSRKQHALKGQKLLAQGNALGLWALAWRPVRAKALKLLTIYKAFALTIIFALGKIKR
jgi:hypothetical protein